MERQLRDELRVALEGRHFAVRGHVPDLNARVGTRNGQALPVGMPGDDLIAHRLRGQVGEEGPARHVVHRCDVRIEVTHGQLAALRVKRQRSRLRGQAPATNFLPRRQIEAEDPLLLGDRQRPAIRAEPMCPAPAELVLEGRLPVGHAPDAEREPLSEAEQESVVGAEEQVLLQERARADVPDLLVVGEAADADDAPTLRAGVAPVLRVVCHRDGARERGVTDRHAADVGQGHRGNGLVTQPLVGLDPGGPGQGGEAIQPLAHLPAEAAGAGPVPQRQEQLVGGVPLAPPGRRQRGLFLFRLVHGDGPRVCGANHAPGRADDAAHQGQDHRGSRQDRPLVPPHEFAQPVAQRRGTRLHRLVMQIMLDVHGQAVGRLVAPLPVLLQRLHHDPVEVALDQQTQLGRLRPAVRPRFAASHSVVESRLLGFCGSSSRMIRRISSIAASLNSFHSERRRAGQEFVQKHTQGIDVAAGVDVRRVERGLLGAHVLQRPDELAVPRERRPLGQLLPGRLRHAEVDDLGDRLFVVASHQHVRRLQITMDDPLLVRVLHRVADRDEKFQPLA